MRPDRFEILRDRRDWLNVLRGVTAPLLFFAPFWVAFPFGFGPIWAVLIFLLVADVNYILHLHIHRPFSRSKAINLLLDLCMGSVTGMTASNWRIQHLHGHHRGDDTRYRGQALDWELERYSPLRALSYCLKSIPPTLWQPVREAFVKGVLSHERRPIDYRWAFAEHALLGAFLLVLALIDASLVLTYVLPAYAAVFFITRYADYLNHYGCDETSDNIFEHANNCTNGLFNAMKNNFGYHTAHHLRPGAHWTALPEIHAEIAGQIPERCIKRVSWSFLMLPYHMVLGARGRM